MAGESRLSEQESGFNTAKSKGIRLSGLLSQAKARQQTGERRGDGERIQVKTKVERERVRDRLKGGGRWRTGVRVVRAVWQQERHDGKLCGTEEQAQPSIRSS